MLETYRYDAGKFPVQFCIFELTGTDVSFFLQNQSTFNFQDLKENEFHLISFLDPQGRVEFYCWALKSLTNVLLLTPVQLKAQAHIRLEKFLISEDVTIEEHGKLRAGCWFFGTARSKRADEPPTLTNTWICSPLHIEAVTFDGQHNNFGRMLRFLNTPDETRD